jgi:hypothetical protein
MKHEREMQGVEKPIGAKGPAHRAARISRSNFEAMET